jgi:hypothetical protein
VKINTFLKIFLYCYDFILFHAFVVVVVVDVDVVDVDVVACFDVQRITFPTTELSYY